jgi:transposase
MKTYSLDLRKKCLEFIERHGSIAEATLIFGPSRATIYAWKNLAEKDELAPKSRGQKTNYKIDLDKLKEYIKEHPDAHLHEIASEFEVSVMGIHYALKRLGITHKKKVFTYAEADPKKRAKFLQKIANKKPNELVYIDESGLIDNFTRDYARAPKGQKIYAQKSAKRSGRINLIAATCAGKTLAQHTFTSKCNTKKFNQWLNDHLIPALKPDQIVILDNATYHKNKTTRQLIEKTGCQLEYLAPYSPDLNPIEHLWANLKRTLKNHRQKYPNITAALQFNFA